MSGVQRASSALFCSSHFARASCSFAASSAFFFSSAVGSGGGGGVVSTGAGATTGSGATGGGGGGAAGGGGSEPQAERRATRRTGPSARRFMGRLVSRRSVRHKPTAPAPLVVRFFALLRRPASSALELDGGTVGTERAVR